LLDQVVKANSSTNTAELRKKRIGTNALKTMRLFSLVQIFY